MPRPKYSNPRLRRFTKRKPGSWYNFYKARSPKTSINPDKFKRIVTLLGASDYSLSEISRMTNTDNSTLSNINSVLKLRTKKEADVIRKIAARAAKVIPEAELKRRENAILTALRHRKEITKDLITFLVRRKRISLEKVVERVRQMEEAGVPFIGLMNKLGASQPKFDGIVARYYNSGLTERQREVHAYLLRRKVSKKIARKVAGTHLEIADLQRKFDFFASFKLDPAIYGVERIPLKMYEHMLLDQLATIKKGIKKKIIYTLEDAQARIELDKLLTGWRKSRALTTKKAGSVIRPANLLRRARALIAAGKKVSVVALTSYSAKTISQGTGANVVSIAESKRRTPIQQRIVFPEDQISKLLDKGIEVGEIAKKNRPAFS